MAAEAVDSITKGHHLNMEQAEISWGTMEWIIFAMFWLPVLYFFIHFSFRSRGAKRAVWQANMGMFCGCLGFLALPAIATLVAMGDFPFEIFMALAGFVTLSGMLAIPLGHTARRRIKRGDGRLVGSGRAGFALVVLHRSGTCPSVGESPSVACRGSQVAAAAGAPLVTFAFDDTPTVPGRWPPTATRTVAPGTTD
jgi:hypothetical protein